ncbi:MAG: hypothetical protein JNG89_17315, partial [Planctomycetaceae bacterium]|nr:hypothetical protein [Planctomycetaceae bacterium]
MSDALGLPRVRHVPAWMAGLLFGFPMVEALCASVRINNESIKRELRWKPRYGTFDEGLPKTLPGLQA